MESKCIIPNLLLLLTPLLEWVAQAHSFFQGQFYVGYLTELESDYFHLEIKRKAALFDIEADITQISGLLFLRFSPLRNIKELDTPTLSEKLEHQ